MPNATHLTAHFYTKMKLANFHFRSKVTSGVRARSCIQVGYSVINNENVGRVGFCSKVKIYARHFRPKVAFDSRALPCTQSGL